MGVTTSKISVTSALLCSVELVPLATTLFFFRRSPFRQRSPRFMFSDRHTKLNDREDVAARRARNVQRRPRAGVPSHARTVVDMPTLARGQVVVRARDRQVADGTVARNYPLEEIEMALHVCLSGHAWGRQTIQTIPHLGQGSGGVIRGRRPNRGQQAVAQIRRIETRHGNVRHVGQKTGHRQIIRVGLVARNAQQILQGPSQKTTAAANRLRG